jgi:hypothetical protein
MPDAEKQTDRKRSSENSRTEEQTRSELPGLEHEPPTIHWTGEQAEWEPPLTDGRKRGKSNLIYLVAVLLGVIAVLLGIIAVLLGKEKGVQKLSLPLTSTSPRPCRDLGLIN